MTRFALVESNTTGTGRQFAAAARARGLRPVLLARDPARYAYAAEDALDTQVLDTTDPQQVLAACRSLAADSAGGGLAGVTSSSEYFAATAAAAARGLGLPGPDPEAVAQCRDKARQRAVLQAAGVPVPGFRAVTSVSQAVEAAAELGRPSVLKPVAGSGSVGVRLCPGPEDTAGWAARLLGDSSGPILVEQAVTGPEFSVETFDGAVVAVVAKRLGRRPWFVETGHDIPAPIPASDRDRLAATTLSALEALGLGWGAAHTELRLSPTGPVVIEVNPRPAGGMIPVAVRAALGVDLVDALVARASGGEPAPPAAAAGYAAIRFRLLPRPGRVRAVHGVDKAARGDGVVAAAALTRPGADLARTGSFTDRVAFVVASGDSARTAARHAERALPLVAVEIEVRTDPYEEGPDDEERRRTDDRHGGTTLDPDRGQSRG